MPQSAGIRSLGSWVAEVLDFAGLPAVRRNIEAIISCLRLLDAHTLSALAERAEARLEEFARSPRSPVGDPHWQSYQISLANLLAFILAARSLARDPRPIAPQ